MEAQLEYSYMVHIAYTFLHVWRQFAPSVLMKKNFCVETQSEVY